VTAPPPDRFSRWVAFLGALVALFQVIGLYDTRISSFDLAASGPAIPALLAERDAVVRVFVVDEFDKPLPNALVRLFSLRSGRTYFAGEARTNAQGVALLDKMPRGESWLLAYGEGRARASTRIVLGSGERVARLVLQPARALDVVVVDETDQPFVGADILVSGSDALPYVAKTGADGKAHVDRLAGGPNGGPFEVRVIARGYDDVVRTGVTVGPVPLRIKLEKLGIFEVSVVQARDGAAVPHARVYCGGAGLWPAREVIADARGIAKIAGLRSGAYSLKAELGDLVSLTEIGLSIERAKTTKVTLVVDVGRRIAITVTDGDAENARHIPNANVVLVEDGLSPFPMYGRTDTQGIVVLGPVAETAMMVSASAEGFVPTSAVIVDAQAIEVRVPLVRGGVLIGEVVDDRGFPVGGASVEVVGTDIEGMPIAVTRAMTAFREDHFEQSLPGSMPLIPVGELGVMLGPIPDLPHEEGAARDLGTDDDPWITNNDGVFRAEPIPPGRVQVIVRHPDYVEAVSELVTLRSGGEAFVRVVLHQGGTLEGRVFDADHRPVAGARVELAATAGTLERVTYADDSGLFVFPAVPHEVLVSVARPDSPSDVVARVVVEILDGERKEIEIVLPKERDSIAVHVTDDRGYAIDRVEVRAISLDPAIPLRRTFFTDDNGDVEVPDAAGLPLRFLLSRPGKTPRVEEADPAPSKIVFELAEGILGQGKVTGRDGRDRIADAEIVLHTPFGVRRAMSNADGDFEFPDLAPGRVRIVASHSSWAIAEKVIDVKADTRGRADLGAIDLPEAGIVEGTVIDPQDEPMGGVRVGFGSVPTYLPLGPLPPGITTTDKEGRFVLKNVPEGDVEIEAYSLEMGRNAVDVKVRAGDTTSRVVIMLPGENTAKKEGKAAGSIALTLGERTDKGNKVVVVVMVPPNGEAEIAGIEPGERLLAVSGVEVRSIEAARKRLSGPLSEDVVVTVVADDENAKPRRLRVRRERVRR
jgi:hypothetical protein